MEIGVISGYAKDSAFRHN